MHLMRLTLPARVSIFSIGTRRSVAVWASERRKRLFYKCANGKCAATFDYRKGRLFRFPYRLKNVETAASHAVVHFWLCAKCTDIYTLEYRERSGAAVLRSKSSPAKKNRQTRVDLQQTAAAGSR